MLKSAADTTRFHRASDQSLLIYFGQQITLDAHDRVRKLLRLLEMEPIVGVRNLHPAYHSVLVKFDPLQRHHDELEDILRRYIGRIENVSLLEPRDVEVPVCYGGGGRSQFKEAGAIHRIDPEQRNKPHSLTSFLV